MPAEKTNPYPYPTPADIAAAPGGREIKAARNILARRISGIPVRPYLMGQQDSAPVVQGVLDLTTICYRLLDATDPLTGGSVAEKAALDDLREILENSDGAATSNRG